MTDGKDFPGCSFTLSSLLLLLLLLLLENFLDQDAEAMENDGHFGGLAGQDGERLLQMVGRRNLKAPAQEFIVASR